jgi:DNA-binding transcriptional ArsR family regulator
MRSQTEAALKAMAEPNRLAILTLIRVRELPAGEIAERFKTTRSAVSQHLRVLSNAGLLTERHVGVKRLYRLRPEGFRGLRRLLDTFWDEKLDRLKAEVELEARRRRDR